MNHSTRNKQDGGRCCTAVVVPAIHFVQPSDLLLNKRLPEMTQAKASYVFTYAQYIGM